MGVGILVGTKLYVPQPRRSLVARPRLSERLSAGAGARLTLVSAPAGFGKTTSLAAWLAPDPGAGSRSVAWLSLDANDARPESFWTYVVTALQSVAFGVGTAALPLLHSAGPRIESVLAVVVNELSAVAEDVYLVLDDYHLVDGPEIQTGMEFLLEHLPPQVHLVLSTRADPALPLARLRARGELVEIRAADLRFTLEEAAAYLNDVTGLALSAADVAALEGRTEGWIAALQLAALSMHGREDVAGFVAGFAGDDRYIVDYLVEEVLARQPRPVRDFLLRTCVLDRLTGQLCDAVTGQPGGRAMLEALDRGNLFVVPLDDSRRWYRYHHLFADVLHAHLADEEPDLVPQLHRRASEWYAQHDEPAPAIRHALAAGDAGRAADLVELAIPALRRARQESTIRGWLDAIPDEVVRVRPVLAIGFVGALMAGGEPADVERRLRQAERWLDPAADRTGMVVVDEAELPRLPGAVALYKAALALGRGDAPGTIEQARLAIDRAPADDHLVRAGASALMGLSLWGGGDLESAHRAYSVCVEGLRRAGHLSDVLGCSITLADIRTTQGRLGDARRTFEDALRLNDGRDGTVLRGTADMYVGLSQLAVEREDRPAAIRYLRLAQDLGEHTWLPQNAYRWRVAMARVNEAEGDLPAALGLLDEATSVYMGDFSPDVRPVPAARARVLTALGRLDDAFAWARERDLSAGDDPSYRLEFEHVTLARALLARYRAQRSESDIRDADGLLRRLLTAAEAGGRTGSAIEILALLALAHHARGDGTGGQAPLQRALVLAEPEGYVRLFAGEGAPMATLLRTAVRQRMASGYARRLLAACEGTPQAPAETPGPGLIEPLSPRELDVLRLLRSDLDGPDIARRLTMSLNTLRTHTKNIYNKLGVNSRRAAVRQAAALNLPR